MSLLSAVADFLKPEPPPDPAVHKALERVAELVDPLLKLAPGFERRLSKPLQHALGYCDGLVAALLSCVTSLALAQAGGATENAQASRIGVYRAGAQRVEIFDLAALIDPINTARREVLYVVPLQLNELFRRIGARSSPHGGFA